MRKYEIKVRFPYGTYLTVDSSNYLVVALFQYLNMLVRGYRVQFHVNK